MRHAVIMAGGAGTRLWPLSRQAKPKHFLRLFDGQSLMRRSFERLAGFLPADNILVVTGAGHLDLVAAELPELPRDNLVGEPAVRDTANAVGLACVLLEARDPQGVMGVFTADHIIRPVERFHAALKRAYDAAAANPSALVTLGVKPTAPHTGYGYVQRGESLGDGVYRVTQFKEKPDVETARQYLDSGEFYWNSGMFVWRIQTLLENFRSYLPQNHAALSGVGDAPAENRAQVLAEIYPKLPKISIDYGVMEKAEHVLVCELDCQWLDVGAWTSLRDILGSDPHGQVLAHPRVVAVDSTNNIYVGEDDHLIATIGLHDTVVVRSPSATLICHKDCVQRIKDLVGRLDEEYR